jgi:hypothetical protein
MSQPLRTAGIAIFCLALSGCYVKVAGNQSTGGGTTTTATSAQVGGSTTFSGGRASFSSGGHPVSPRMQGGYAQASGSGTATAVLLIGVGIVEFLNYVAGTPPPRPLPPGEAIGHTCSCYGYQPRAAPVSAETDEVRLMLRD